ncbi:MAG TPA: hypothetical protein VN876_03095 [Gemmatimonadaceae bacterium]|nr:hypothetical protein [Gemmatimonadaceae bacterium]
MNRSWQATAKGPVEAANLIVGALRQFEGSTTASSDLTVTRTLKSKQIF